MGTPPFPPWPRMTLIISPLPPPLPRPARKPPCSSPRSSSAAHPGAGSASAGAETLLPRLLLRRQRPVWGKKRNEIKLHEGLHEGKERRRRTFAESFPGLRLHNGLPLSRLPKKRVLASHLPGKQTFFAKFSSSPKLSLPLSLAFSQSQTQAGCPPAGQMGTH